MTDVPVTLNVKQSETDDKKSENSVSETGTDTTFGNPSFFMETQNDESDSDSTTDSEGNSDEDIENVDEEDIENMDEDSEGDSERDHNKSFSVVSVETDNYIPEDEETIDESEEPEEFQDLPEIFPINAESVNIVEQEKSITFKSSKRPQHAKQLVKALQKTFIGEIQISNIISIALVSTGLLIPYGLPLVITGVVISPMTKLMNRLTILLSLQIQKYYTKLNPKLGLIAIQEEYIKSINLDPRVVSFDNKENLVVNVLNGSIKNTQQVNSILIRDDDIFLKTDVGVFNSSSEVFNCELFEVQEIPICDIYNNYQKFKNTKLFGYEHSKINHLKTFISLIIVCIVSIGIGFIIGYILSNKFNYTIPSELMKQVYSVDFCIISVVISCVAGFFLPEAIQTNRTEIINLLYICSVLPSLVSIGILLSQVYNKNEVTQDQKEYFKNMTCSVFANILAFVAVSSFKTYFTLLK